MLTPIFKLSQDETHVFINIHAPYTNIGETEIDVDGENFLFVSSPYFLRLRLSGRIVESDGSKGSYEVGSGDFNLTFCKEVPGENFENLDMITSLLSPRDIPDVNPDLVEMLDEGGISIQEDEEEEPGDKFTYGFAGKMTKDFCAIGKEFPTIFELRAPERFAGHQRHKLRIHYEDHKFSPDHYLADLYEEYHVGPCLSSNAPWDEPDFENTDFNEDEISILKELPNKHYILTKKEHLEVFLGLVDILYAFCYEKRTTFNETSVESSWTINKVSPLLTWFCTFNDLKEVLIACYRRALTFPIYRHYKLCDKVKGDLQSLMSKGKKFIIKCMLEIYVLFNTSYDARYILNQLYIKDYLIFLQKCKEEEFQDLAKRISEIELQKTDLGMHLDVLETAAALVEDEQTEAVVNAMALQLTNMALKSGLKLCPEMLEDEEGWVTSSSGPSESSSDDSSDESSSEELDSDDDSS